MYYYFVGGKEPKHDGASSESKAASTQKPSEHQQSDVSKGAGSREPAQAQAPSPSHSSKHQPSGVIVEQQPEKQADAILLDTGRDKSSQVSKTAAKESSPHQGMYRLGCRHEPCSNDVQEEWIIHNPHQMLLYLRQMKLRICLKTEGR